MLAVRDNITQLLAEGFTRSAVDGLWYPSDAQQERALARVHVADSGYCVERRRSPTSPWAPVAVVPVAEFDPEAFRVWRRAWRLTA